MFRSTLYIGIENIDYHWRDNPFFTLISSLGYTVTETYGWCDGKREASIKVEIYTDDALSVEDVARLVDTYDKLAIGDI